MFYLGIYYPDKKYCLYSYRLYLNNVESRRLPVINNIYVYTNIYRKIYLYASQKQYYTTTTFIGISAGIVLSKSYAWLLLGFAFLGLTTCLGYLTLKKEVDITALNGIRLDYLL